MRRFFDRIFSFLKRVLVNRYVLGTAAVLLLGWFIYRNVRPVIHQIPVLPAGSDLILIEGDNFGSEPGERFQVVMEVRPGLTVALSPVEWSQRQIQVRLPADVARGGTHQIQVRRTGGGGGGWLDSAWAPLVTQLPNLPSAPYGYATPLQADAPWPVFRRDHRNSGASPLPAVYQGDRPWMFQTGKGIFSTPVIDAEGIVYVGSADHNFYALTPEGEEKWRFQSDELIDSAAAIPRQGLLGDAPAILLPSGDGRVYHLNRETGEPIWSFTAPDEAFNSWFEGNVQLGYDGAIYAGNTNFNYYAINPDGTLRWTHETGANAWSIGGLAEDGAIYWGSNDTYVYAVAADGEMRWRKMTLGFIAASAAVGGDGAVYIGSFDSYFYALDPMSGDTKWRFKTGDHIYSSAALGADEAGNTDAIYFGSADGRFYALDTDGELRWSYDTGDVIRSSPALGRGPDGEGEIVYFGAGNGRFYALDAATGERRWSFETTADDPVLRDRNDLNASPALGESGVYFAGEHGQVWYVPYDYCLHAEDARCNTDPGSDLPNDVAGLFYVTPGGNTQFTFPRTLPTATMITLRLIVREEGETVDAWVCNNPLYCPDDALEVEIEPETPFTWEKSADGHYIYIRPDGFLEPDTDYRLSVQGRTYSGGLALGNLQLGGRSTGVFSDTFRFQTEPLPADLPLAISPDAVTAFEWTRLAAPIPPMLPSLNQIGFDYMDWIVAPAAITPAEGDAPGRVIFWASGARRDEAGRLLADPDSDFLLPFSGVYQGNDLIFQNESIVMEVTGIPIPFNLLEMRGRLGSDLRMEEATVYADTEALSIPTFGPYLVVGGLANEVYKKLLVSGAFVTRPYPPGDPANKAPQGVSLVDLSYTPPGEDEAGAVTATLQLPPDFDPERHRPAILLIDAAETEAVYLNYAAGTETAVANEQAAVTLTIPAGTALPVDLEAVILFDVFPLAYESLR